MTPERWQKIEQLCHAALEREAYQRGAFLEEACRGDNELLSEVESLMAQEKTAEGFLLSGGAEAAANVWTKMQDENAGRSMIGRQFGSYQVSCLLGVGGMGEVYQALDTKLRRDVAIKVLPSALVHDRERLARFQREARMLASLNHPNIATIHGLEQSGDVHFLVMELVPGQTLAERVISGALPLEEVLKVAGQIAEALEAAHEKGVIHRDLKPANVKVTPEGRVKVLDFGLAKVFPGDEGRDLSDASTVTIAGTEDGRILGTPAYMSPEQARGKAVDQRTDIWAFGVVLYELLTGRLAFPGETVFDTIAAVLEREPDWQALPTTTPMEVRDLLRRCLQKDVQLRLHNFGDARIEIQAAFENRTDLRRQKRDSDLGLPASTATALKSVPKSIQVRWVAIAGAAVLVVTLAAGGWLLYPRKAHALTDKDTIVLADFDNKTGDPVFDDTLRQGLSIQLEQSPFLSLVSDESIYKVLGLMGSPPDARLTPELAREVCERNASAAVLDGSIANLGSQYVLGLRARNCRTGTVLDQEQVQAGRKEDVLNALSQIASKFRTRIGESLATVEKHETPLAEATTPSLEALKLYSTAVAVNHAGNESASLTLLKRAIEIDPKFAVAYAYMGQKYGNLGESDLSAQNNRKAYELRDRASDAERFLITSVYDMEVTGNMEKAQENFELWAQAFPREYEAPGLLSGGIYPALGKYEKGVEAARRAIAINPNIPFAYGNLATNLMFLDRLEEAETPYQQATKRNLAIPDFAVERYDLAFLRGDQAEMEHQATLGLGKAVSMSEHEAAAQAYSGHLQQARRTSRQGIDLAKQRAKLERAAVFEGRAAVREAFFGNAPEARRGAMEVLVLSKNREAQSVAALALAFSGEASRSQTIADDLEKGFPENTEVQFTILPELRALLALNHGKPEKAIDALQVAVPYELGVPFSFYGALYPVYVRGLSYLADHQGAEAAAEFQKILGHRGIVHSDPIGALAHLQLGRALVLSGDKPKAKTAYQDFLTLWKDADPDIPILKQAKAEYAKLQ